jgi:heme O synthase-like polyprenyltransferase
MCRLMGPPMVICVCVFGCMCARVAGHMHACTRVSLRAPLSWHVCLLQLPHFLSLAYLCREDYARGGYRMLSLCDTLGRRTGACVLRNALYLLPLGLVATWLGVTSPAFAYEATIASGVPLSSTLEPPSNPTSTCNKPPSM